MTVQLIHYVKQSVKTGWKYPIEDFPIENGEIGKDGVEDSIAAIKRDFVAAAIRAKEAGFDGIELHAAHGYTLSSFVSLLNKRKDQYGGNEEGRGRIVTEIIEECRKALGADYCIGVRISGEEFVIGGNTIKHTPTMSQMPLSSKSSPYSRLGILPETITGTSEPISRRPFFIASAR